jgi:hypothetical protein
MDHPAWRGFFRSLGRCIDPMSYREMPVIEIVEMRRLWLQELGLRRWPGYRHRPQNGVPVCRPCTSVRSGTAIVFPV